MSRSEATPDATRSASTGLAALMALTLAVGAGLLLTQLMMAPPASELREMALYLTLAGAATMGAGWLVVRLIDDGPALSIRAKTFASAATGSGVALVNILIVAQLMFVSTAHDLKLLIALLAFSGVVTLCFTMWVASTISRRLGRVAVAIRGLAAGDYGARVAIAGKDEVAGLAADVNALAQRLLDARQQQERLDAERRDLTAAISHDLRTPLASVRAMVEALDERVVDEPEEIARYYGAIRRETDRLSRMIDDLFELARMDAGALELDLRPLAVQDIAAEVVEGMQAQARRKGVRLELSASAALPAISIDGARVERALCNLVQNAIEHTPHGGRVEVSIAGVDGSIELQVADSGGGIASEDVPRVWQRFFRADKARQRPSSNDGAGLGLAIVRGIVEAHGGSVGVSSKPGAGARFTIRLPRA